MVTSNPGDERNPSPAEFSRTVQKLTKINQALMQRVERSMDQQANAFSLFQTAIGLENQVKLRTDELKAALAKLEITNAELSEARDAADRANRFKTRFFTAAGHDLLQPLHAARLSLAELADAQYMPGNKRLALNISRALTTIEDLLTSILDISKLEAGAFVPNLQTLSLGELFEHLIAAVEPSAKRKGLKVRFRPTQMTVVSDPLMLRRILQNLLANAVNYTNGGGILLGARRRGNDVAIEVWDTGPGIAAAERARIFEEFQRGAASERAGGSGFGLGLSIVKRMCEALHHPLDLSSRVGRGSKFFVTVPYSGAKATARTAEAAPASVSSMLSRQVLIIDNDLPVLEAMQTLLSRWGADVRLARDMDNIAEVAADPTFRCDIILADYHLDHGVIGLDAVARVRELTGSGLPAILITADRTQATIDQAHAAGCEVLHKPVRPAELRALIHHLVT